jgi:hypothetical protein
LVSKSRFSEEFFFTFCCFLQLADHSPILDCLDLFSSPFRSSRRSAIVPGSSALRPLRRVQCKSDHSGEPDPVGYSVKRENSKQRKSDHPYKPDLVRYSMKRENSKQKREKCEQCKSDTLSSGSHEL